MLRLEKIKKVNDVEILIISNSTDFTTDYICIELNKRTNKYLRINRDLFRSYSVDFCIDTLELLICIENAKYRISPSVLKSVYYRAPIYLHYIPRESLSFEEQLYRSQWMAFLRNIMLFENVLWMNNPTATFKAENKMLQLKYARESGLQCPTTHLLNSTDFISLDDKTSYVVKSLDTVILRKAQREAFCYTNILTGKEIKQSYIASAPIVLQDNISPKIDIRVTVVGKKAFPVKITNNGDGINGDWRKHKDIVDFIPFELPCQVENACIEVARKLGLWFGGIDLAFSSGKYYFIEINPTGEWAWLINSTGLRIDKAICDYLTIGV
mgnify:FL=1